MSIFKKKIIIFIVSLVILNIVACQKDTWDVGTVAIVNKRIIKQEDLDVVLKAGNYPHLASKEDLNEKDVLELPQIIDKLINQELMLEEAEKLGLDVNLEYEKALKIFEESWAESPLPEEEKTIVKQGLYKQLLLHKITMKVALENKINTEEEWEVFWDNWLEQKAEKPSALVKVILLPKEKELKEKLSKIKAVSLLIKKLEEEKIAYVYSEPFLLKQTEPEKELFQAFKKAFQEKEGERITGFFELEESFFVYEVLEFKETPDMKAEMAKAKTVFEEYNNEKAFLIWLADLKNKADIKINPLYKEL